MSLDILHNNRGKIPNVLTLRSSVFVNHRLVPELKSIETTTLRTRIDDEYDEGSINILVNNFILKDVKI